jgi:HEAT repeat protein
LALNQLAANAKGPWKSLAGDERLPSMLAGLLSDGDLQEPALRLITALHLTGMNDQILALANNTKASDGVRVLAVQSAAQQNGSEKNATVASLRKLLANERPLVRNAAVLALVDLQDFRSVRDALANQNGQFPTRFRSDVVNRMLASTGGALAILKLVQDDQLPAQFPLRAIERHDRRSSDERPLDVQRHG